MQRSSIRSNGIEGSYFFFFISPPKGSYFYIEMTIYDKHTDNIILCDLKTELYSKVRHKARMFIVPL